MTWPCPDCHAPFTFDHMCPLLEGYLRKDHALSSWRWLARTLMLEAHSAQQAFQVEQSLRVGEAQDG